jgi:hypothetical protein
MLPRGCCDQVTLTHKRCYSWIAGEPFQYDIVIIVNLYGNESARVLPAIRTKWMFDRLIDIGHHLSAFIGNQYFVDIQNRFSYILLIKVIQCQNLTNQRGIL